MSDNNADSSAVSDPNRIHSVDGPRIRSAALQVLDDLLQLRLTEARWERVAGILGITAEAAAAGDLGTLRTAAKELQMVGPVRIIRIGSTPVGPPPVKVRERVELIRGLLESADASQEQGKGSADDAQ